MLWNLASTRWKLSITTQSGERYTHPVYLIGAKNNITKQLSDIMYVLEILEIPETFLFEKFNLEIII